MPSRRRIPLALSLAALALPALAGCGGSDRTAVVTTVVSTATQTVTVEAPATATDTAPSGTTTVPAPLTLHGAERVLAARGYEPLTERDWRPDETLKVLIGIRRAQPRAELAFLFAGGRFLGTDTRDPSGAIEVVAQDRDRVTLGYGLYRPGDALCCASAGTAHVTYVWDGTRLSPQSAIPSADPGAALSRR